MGELLAFGAAGLIALGALLFAGLKLLEFGVRFVVLLIMLPFQILGGILGLLGSLIALPFQLLGWLLGGLGFLLGFVLLPLLPLALLALFVVGIVACVRAARRPARLTS